MTIAEATQTDHTDRLIWSFNMLMDVKATAEETSGALTVMDITRPSASPCDGSAHGTATATLDEVVDGDAGSQTSGPGRVMLQTLF